MNRITAGFGSVFVLLLCVALGVAEVRAQEAPVFFREDWAEIPPSLPVTQEHVASEELTLHLYGPGGDQVKKSHHEAPPLDPYYVWSGRCNGTWAVTLSHADAAVDLSGAGAEIRWRSRPSGFRSIRVVLKVADGPWLVSEQADTTRGTWHEWRLSVEDAEWWRLDIEQVTEGEPVETPDLRRVAEVGFTDLMRGGGSPASSRIDWIEVRGMTVNVPESKK
jgi:hypothetical protein